MKSEKKLNVHLLVCKRDLEMAIKSVSNSQKYCTGKYNFVFHDDGSLDK